MASLDFTTGLSVPFDLLEGAILGIAVGCEDGFSVGKRVGVLDGLPSGWCVGCSDGALCGQCDGCEVGHSEGLPVGNDRGCREGIELPGRTQSRGGERSGGWWRGEGDQGAEEDVEAASGGDEGRPVGAQGAL